MLRIKASHFVQGGGQHLPDCHAFSSKKRIKKTENFRFQGGSMLRIIHFAIVNRKLILKLPNQVGLTDA